MSCALLGSVIPGGAHQHPWLQVLLNFSTDSGLGFAVLFIFLQKYTLREVCAPSDAFRCPCLAPEFSKTPNKNQCSIPTSVEAPGLTPRFFCL